MTEQQKESVTEKDKEVWKEILMNRKSKREKGWDRERKRQWQREDRCTQRDKRKSHRKKRKRKGRRERMREPVQQESLFKTKVFLSLGLKLFCFSLFCFFAHFFLISDDLSPTCLLLQRRLFCSPAFSFVPIEISGFLLFFFCPPPLVGVPVRLGRVWTSVIEIWLSWPENNSQFRKAA